MSAGGAFVLVLFLCGSHACQTVELPVPEATTQPGCALLAQRLAPSYPTPPGLRLRGWSCLEGVRS